MQVLYVGTETRVNRVILKAIEKSKKEITFETLASGKSAVTQLLDAEELPQIIFIDCDLKDIKCKTFIEFLRKHDRLKNTKIIAVSTHFSQFETRQFQKLGVYRCVAINTDVDQSMLSVLTLLDEIN